MRTDYRSYKRLVKDMEALGLRHRLGHDLRPTVISLARTDGAGKDILELCTHTPRKSGYTRYTIDLYTTFPWEALAPRSPSSRSSSTSAASSSGCPRGLGRKRKPRST